jgi:hypothetical protein
MKAVHPEYLRLKKLVPDDASVGNSLNNAPALIQPKQVPIVGP